MVVTTKYQIELSEWEVVSVGELVEVLDMNYDGFTVVRYKGKQFYCHSEYLNIPVLNHAY